MPSLAQTDYMNIWVENNFQIRGLEKGSQAMVIYAHLLR